MVIKKFGHDSIGCPTPGVPILELNLVKKLYCRSLLGSLGISVTDRICGGYKSYKSHDKIGCVPGLETGKCGFEFH
jgi:hypothetical protein